MKTNITTAQATEQDLIRQKHRCYAHSSGCHRFAWLEWLGYRMCLKHWFSDYTWGGGQHSFKAFIYRLCHTNINF